MSGPELEWRMWVCADCPQEDEEERYHVAHRVPVGAVWERSCDLDFCPACGGHHPFTPYGRVEVTTR